MTEEKAVPRDYKEIDGLITNTPNVTLVSKYADCTVIFVDPAKKAIGLSHSGWKELSDWTDYSL